MRVDLERVTKGLDALRRQLDVLRSEGVAGEVVVTVNGHRRVVGLQFSGTWDPQNLGSLIAEATNAALDDIDRRRLEAQERVLGPACGNLLRETG